LQELLRSIALTGPPTDPAAQGDLVWVLERLAWQPATFESAADRLLRLALSDEEALGGHASAAWVALFGTSRSAAGPQQRLAYIRGIAHSEDTEARRRAVAACGAALATHETLAAPAEPHAGPLLAASGTPEADEEWAAYRRGAVIILDELTRDTCSEIADAADEALLRSLSPFVGDPLMTEELAGVLAARADDRRVQVRRRAEQHLALLRRVDVPGSEARIEGRERLPAATPVEQLGAWLQCRAWDRGDGELRSHILETLKGVTNRTSADFISQTLGQDEVAGAWDLGRALARLAGKDDKLERNLRAVYSANPAALIGYLRGLMDEGYAPGCGDVPHRERAGDLDALRRAVSGVCAAEDRSRVVEGAGSLPVAQGAALLFRWQGDLDQDDVKDLLDMWLDRIQSQADYNAVVEWFHFWLYLRAKVPRWLRSRTFRLLMLRRRYPDIGYSQWDWCQFASSFSTGKTSALRTLLLDLISDGSLMVLGDDRESALLAEAAKADPVGLWADVADRLLAGDWRMSMDVRGWLLQSLPAGIPIEWIGADVERARQVAKVASVGGDEPTTIVRFLLDRFGDDDKVSSSLAMDFIRSRCSGEGSDRLEAQLVQMNTWQGEADEPAGVKRWAGRMIVYLEARRGAAVRREAGKPGGPSPRLQGGRRKDVIGEDD
jgi:hypothetical protein